ncbi:siroheme synthase [Lactococcus hodotermopsidis]|uniref:precorrin-2 dehydrogenase n=1 Tax=Pseudolactococcus hodotermopsidis TaxID=2709157 RepID=A0A6A0BAR4_9LACT|nr:bifunctional precorrin-2 dehydrogenase/sirohydrochlorin ferrochelatase [Lactococcus hodotermopsidis]GFH41733.1 siroheme synthase [Lactococcus hodotermopsidis]
MIPILYDLRDTKILVIGGGKVATRKILRLSQENADITVIAPDISQTIASLVSANKILRRPFQIGDTTGYDMIFICTSDQLTNQKIVKEIQPYQLLNDTTNHDKSTFFSMAEIDYKNIKITLSSGGLNPSEIKKIKEKLVTFLHEKN